jgi:hypothetical protein
MTQNKTPLKRLYKQSLLAMAQNAVGSRMFATFYAEQPDGTVIDTFEAGNVSCAAFVSGTLTMLGKLKSGFHGTVMRTVQDLQESGWQEVSDIQPGDVIVWAPRTENGRTTRHIGFAVSETEAISTSSSQRVVVRHDMHYGAEQRPIEYIFRLLDWNAKLG